MRIKYLISTFAVLFLLTGCSLGAATILDVPDGADGSNVSGSSDAVDIPVASSGKLPDLLISSIDVSIADDGLLNLSYSILNNGGASASAPFSLAVLADGDPVTEAIVLLDDASDGTDISIGQSYSRGIGLNLDGDGPVPGKYSFIVDSLGVVSESDEANNSIPVVIR